MNTASIVPGDAIGMIAGGLVANAMGYKIAFYACAVTAMLTAPLALLLPKKKSVSTRMPVVL